MDNNDCGRYLIIDDRFKLSQSNKKSKFYNKRFSELSIAHQEQIRNYDLVIEEL